MATPANTQTCPDGHICENGSLCIETVQEGKFVCDCDESNINGAQVFAGLYCSHKATVYCTLNGPDAISTTSFCTNDGTCKGNVGKNQDHLGCDCPRGYSGKHCQFVEGSEPDAYDGSTAADSINAFSSVGDAVNGGDGAGLGTAGLVCIILLALAIMGGGFAFLLRRQRQLATTHTIEPTKASDGNLPEAEGSESLSMPTRTFESDGTHHNEHDDEELKIADSGQMA